MPETIEHPAIENPAFEMPAIPAPGSDDGYETFAPPSAKDETLTKIEAIKAAHQDMGESAKVSTGIPENQPTIVRPLGHRQSSQMEAVPGPVTQQAAQRAGHTVVSHEAQLQ